MAFMSDSTRIRIFITSVVASALLLSGCVTSPSVSDTEAPEESSGTTEQTETTAASETATETTVPTPTKAPAATSESDESSSEENTAETSETSKRDVGTGSFGFQKGNLIFHSSVDISMLIQPEDVTLYDYGARNISCDWIDLFYVKETYDFSEIDSTYRFLAFYDNDMSVTFSGYTEIGDWTTPKGSELQLYICAIKIISHNLEITILPQNPSTPEYYNVSICGRGYYASAEQLQMMDVVLSALHENPGVDPLDGIVPGFNHTYYF